MKTAESFEGAASSGTVQTAPSDRELLELAAKAAGGFIAETGDIFGRTFATFGDQADRLWNPLTDDGDALRLAVKLEIQVSTPIDSWQAEAYDKNETFCCVEPVEGSDIYAATRRAIVSAAAEIGRKQ